MKVESYKENLPFACCSLQYQMSYEQTSFNYSLQSSIGILAEIHNSTVLKEKYFLFLQNFLWIADEISGIIFSEIKKKKKK